MIIFFSIHGMEWRSCLCQNMCGIFYLLRFSTNFYVSVDRPLDGWYIIIPSHFRLLVMAVCRNPHICFNNHEDAPIQSKFQDMYQRSLKVEIPKTTMVFIVTRYLTTTTMYLAISAFKRFCFIRFRWAIRSRSLSRMCCR